MDVKPTEHGVYLDVWKIAWEPTRYQGVPIRIQVMRSARRSGAWFIV